MKIGSAVRLKGTSRLLAMQDIISDYGIGIIVGYTDDNGERCWLVLWPNKGFKQWRSADVLEVVSE